MNGLERVVAAIRFEQTDTSPVIAQVFGLAARLQGVRLRDYLTNGALLAGCQLGALDCYGYDAIFSLMDVNVESEALGSRLIFSDDHYPEIGSYAFADGFDLDHCTAPNPLRAGRMPVMLESLSVMRRAVGDATVVVGCVLGPMTLVTQLLGIERALFLAADDPETFGHLLDFAVNVGVTYGKAQIDAGAHLPVVFEPSGSQVVVPPAFFREMLQPRLQVLFAALTEAGSAANWLHIAGRTQQILPYYAAAGVNIANFDYDVTASEAQAALPHVCLDGNIKTLSFVEDEPDALAATATHLLRAFAARGGFILSSGCEIPLDARAENVAALVAAARQGS